MKNRDSRGRFVKGHKSGMSGKKQSATMKKKISKKLKRHKFWGGEKGWFKKGQHHSPKTEFKKGQKAWNKGTGITPEEHKFRMSRAYYKWRREVFERDDYTCQICGKRGGKLNADHIKSYSKYPKLRIELSNGRALCVDCHRKTPNFGWKPYNKGNKKCY